MRKQFLHVGCGPARKAHVSPGLQSDEWREIRFDIDERVQPDIVGTMTNMSAVQTASMDAVFSSHNIEHLVEHEVPVALGEFRRVLKDDGLVLINCPDARSIAQLVVDDRLTDVAYVSSAGPITAHDMLFGLGAALAAGNKYMAHRCAFTSKTLTQVLQQAGFAAVAVMRRPKAYDLWAVACKGRKTQPEMEKLVKEHLPTG